MKICVIGCGAIGGLISANIARNEKTITVFDRGIQFDAIKNNGLVLQQLDGSQIKVRNLCLINDLNNCEPQDLIFLAVKAYEIDSISKDLSLLFHDNTTLITMQNGIPWWYFQKHPGELNDRALKTVDPQDRISTNIPSRNIVGCVSYPAAEVIAPGVVRHIEGTRFPIGELDGSTTERITQVSNLLTNAGFKSPVINNIRAEIWLKAWGTLALNPLSALTKATMAQICQDTGTREYAIKLMLESQEVANKLGINFRVPLERRILGAEKVGAHKTSMLQDLEAGRRLEIEATLGVVIELAEITKVDVPNLKHLYAIIKLCDETNRSEIR